MMIVDQQTREEIAERLLGAYSVTASIPVGPGDTVTAAFAGLGRVTARFAAGEA